MFILEIVKSRSFTTYYLFILENLLTKYSVQNTILETLYPQK